jgi:hypothetical protein
MLRILGLRKILIATPRTCKFFLNCNFYFYAFILCLAYTLVIIFSYAPFSAHFKKMCNIYYICPRLFAPAHFILFKPKLKNLLYSTVFLNSGAASYGSNCSNAVIAKYFFDYSALNMLDLKTLISIFLNLTSR